MATPQVTPQDVEHTTTQAPAATIDPPDDQAEENDMDSDLMRILGAINNADPAKLHALADQVESWLREDEDEQGPRLSLDKAHGEFKHLVRWLQGRSNSEKLAAIALSTCLDGDVEMEVQRRGLYDGEIGQDLNRDWDEAVSAMIEDEKLDGELAVIAAYTLGLNAAK